jgi:hypothetical protein
MRPKNQPRFGRLGFDGDGEGGLLCDGDRRPTGSSILYRAGDGFTICRIHLQECRHFRFGGGPLRAVALGVRERLHAAVAPACVMCETIASLNKVCAHCETPLHPQWPSVYCSNTCALSDA